MKKLTINTAAGITDIVMSVISLIVPGLLFIWGCTPANQSDGFAGTVFIFYLIYAIVLVLNIVALVKSKKAGLKLYGHVCAVIAGGLYMLLGVFAGIPCLVLYIIASVGILKQQPSNK